MRLPVPFVRLALRVDADRLAADLGRVPASAWRPHPEGAPGNVALPLVAAQGDAADDATTGPMRPTPALALLPYHHAVLAALGAPIGRTRLMAIQGEGQLAQHADTNRYWQDHLRVHIPVVTDPSVRFSCDGEDVHMAAGEVWIFDTWRRHGVVNPAGTTRTHLVVDTVGSAALWALVEAGRRHGDAGPAIGGLVPDDGAAPAYESVNAVPVTTPWQQAAHAADLLTDLGAAADGPFGVLLRDLVADWRAAWAVHGDDLEGRPAFASLVRRADQALDALPPRSLPNGTGAAEAIRQLVLRPAVSWPATATDRRATHRRTSRRIERPVIIVSPPRSGSSMLFEALATAAKLYTIGGESHEVLEGIPSLRPDARGWASNALEAADATAEVVRRLDEDFAARCVDRDGRAPTGVHPFRLLEKTPKNALRVPFLAEAFPDATFVLLHRDPRETMSSMLDAWRSGRFVTYPSLPGWPGPAWSLLLVPGWRDLVGRPLPEVVAAQWATTMTTLLDDLEALDPDRWCVASHARLIEDPDDELRRLCEHTDLVWDRPVQGPLPLSRHTLDPPAAGKWRRNADELEPVWPTIADVVARAEAIATTPVAPRRVADRPAPDEDHAGTHRARAAGPTAFASSHTATLGELLQRAASSLVVTTYQSGRVVLVRADEDGHVNTHLRALPRPMGVAAQRGRLAIGTDQAVWVLHDQPAVAAKIEPAGSHDACFVPRSARVTGDISVHELAWADDELWVVNTRFSCLATLDDDHSFVPRWRPPFVTALAPEDRCHLNGLAVVDSRPRFVTALGITDEPQGWRAGKVGGGVVLDVDSGAVVAHGLTMPHSPRWHRGQLWVLDSGHGTLARVDLASGDVEPIVRLPGFTRGLAFIGRYALVGLSKVREHVFAGLPLAEHGDERRCGVWVVDVEAGKTVGFLRFEGSVEEVFDVQVLVGVRYPELLEPGDPAAAGAFLLPEERAR